MEVRIQWSVLIWCEVVLVSLAGDFLIEVEVSCVADILTGQDNKAVV